MTSNFITYIEDSLFWTVSAITVIYTMFVFNNGEIRGYIFVGLFLGIAIYMLFFSKTIVKISVKVIVFIKKIVYTIFKVLIYPFKVILNLAKKILGIPYKWFSKIGLIMTSNLKKYYKFKIKSKNNEKLENKEGF